MNSTRTALITGAGKGIGFEVARQLAAKGFHVFFTARNPAVGRKAALEAEKEKGTVTFLELDVSDPESIFRAAAEFLKTNDRLDVLINNAGILLDGSAGILESNVDMIKETLQTNTLGPLLVARAFVPMLSRSDAPRIVNVSSGGGQLTEGAETWAPAYCISKTALNAVTCQLAVSLPKFAVNSVCPGWVRTDMGGPGATRSVEEGADTIVWLATDAPQELTSQFLRDRKPIPW